MKKQQGSAHVVIIIILVVALVAALGWIFYQNVTKQKSDKNAVVSSTDGTKEKVKPVEKPMYEGVTVTVLGGAYSLKVPNGWVLINNTTDDEYFGRNYLTTGPGLGGGSEAVPAKLMYDESKKPTIQQQELGGWGGFAELFTISTEAYEVDGEEKVTSFKLDDGTEGKKYETIVAANPNSEYFATEHNFYTYHYVFKKGSSTVQAVYSIFENNKSKYDQTLIENAVRSISIN